MAPGYYGTWLLWFLATIVNCNYGAYLVTMVPDFTSFDAPSVSGNLGVKGGPVLHCCMYQIWHQLVPCNFTSSETSNCSSPHLFDKMFLKIASPLLLFLPLCSWMMARWGPLIDPADGEGGDRQLVPTLLQHPPVGWPILLCQWDHHM